MYLIDRVPSASLIENLATDSPPFGPGFSTAQCQKAIKMEIWGTSFNDTGPDYTVFKLFDRGGRVIAEKRIDGY